jgi:hypothetical protein
MANVRHVIVGHERWNLSRVMKAPSG